MGLEATPSYSIWNGDQTISARMIFKAWFNQCNIQKLLLTERLSIRAVFSFLPPSV